MLEELGSSATATAAAGREEFHVLPGADHGHLQCRALPPDLGAGAGRSTAGIVEPIERRFAFTPDVGHLTISGLCAECAGAARADDRPAAAHDH